jgi:hypothetical protein
MPVVLVGERWGDRALEIIWRENSKPILGGNGAGLLAVARSPGSVKPLDVPLENLQHSPIVFSKSGSTMDRAPGISCG